MNFGGSYTKVELAKDVSVLNSSKGDRLPGTPEYNVSLGLDYEFDLAEYPAYIRTDYAYVSDSYNMIGEQGNRAGDYTEVNIISGVTFGDFNVEVFAFNVTDEDSYTSTTAIFLIQEHFVCVPELWRKFRLPVLVTPILIIVTGPF